MTKTTLLCLSMILSMKSFAQDAAAEAFQGRVLTNEMIQSTMQTYLPSSDVSLSSAPMPANTTCSKTEFEFAGHKDTAKWCIVAADRTKNPYVLYHFHGITGSEKTWSNNYTAQLIQTWTDKGLPMPTVITVSFGPVWLLTDALGSRMRYDLFTQKIMPFLESKLPGSVSAAQRILLGESMGGFNGTQVMLRNPELFSRFAVHCPAVTTIGPFDSKGTVKDYIQRTGALSILVWMTKLIGMFAYKHPSQWNAAAPISLAEKLKALPTRTYFSCGNLDEFGFDEGTFTISNRLRGKTKELQEIHIPNGHHMTVDIPTLASFLSADWP